VKPRALSKSSSGGKSHDDGFYTTTRFRECDRVLVQGIRNCDITPDGRHFISVSSGEMQSGTVVVPEIQVALNWFEELKQK
jgi:hypothetical protein